MTHPDVFEQAIRESGEGWLIDTFHPRSGAMAHIRQILDAVNEKARARLGGDAPSLSEAALLAEYRRNSIRVRGFFQALAFTRTSDILLMVWRIIQGMEIDRVSVNYSRYERFEMQVVLISPDGEEDEVYASSDIDDFRVFSHIGILKMGDSPVLDGFYPLKVSG